MNYKNFNAIQEFLELDAAAINVLYRLETRFYLHLTSQNYGQRQWIYVHLFPANHSKFYHHSDSLFEETGLKRQTLNKHIESFTKTLEVDPDGQLEINEKYIRKLDFDGKLYARLYDPVRKYYKFWRNGYKFTEIIPRYAQSLQELLWDKHELARSLNVLKAAFDDQKRPGELQNDGLRNMLANSKPGKNWQPRTELMQTAIEIFKLKVQDAWNFEAFIYSKGDIELQLTLERANKCFHRVQSKLFEGKIESNSLQYLKTALERELEAKIF